MNAPFPPPSDDASNRRLAELERRLARLEAHLGVAPESLPDTPFTEVTAASAFWEAEPEHQDYLERIPNGYTCHFIRPGWKLPVRASAAG